MQKLHTVRLLSAAVLLALSAAATTGANAASTASDAGGPHPSAKRAHSEPPPADLSYTITAKQHGLTINGTANVQWRAGDGKYSLAVESRAAIFGKILETRSEGLIDDYGLAPVSFYEKRFRKEANTTSFKRDTKTISFSVGDETYPIKGGEQDRASIQWQIASQARATPDKFKPGSEFAYFVAGRRDADQWSFKVANVEPVQTGSGEVSAVHLVRSPLSDDKGSQVDLWLAPSLDWYPVRVVFKDADGDFVDQVLDKVAIK